MKNSANYFFVILLISLASCSLFRSSKPIILDAAQANCHISKLSADSSIYNLTMALSERQWSEISNSLTSVAIVSEKKLIKFDSIRKNSITKTIVASKRIANKDNLLADDNLKAIFSSAERDYEATAKIISEDEIGTAAVSTASKLFEFTPKATMMGDSSAEFALTLRRIASAGKEFFPNGERLRITIKNKKGATVWSSNYRANYTQSLGKVLPENIGGEFTYRIIWRGIDNDKSKTPSGEYEIEYFLNSMPNPIFTTTKFKWK